MAAAIRRHTSVSQRAPQRPSERAMAGVKAESLRAMNLSLALRHILAAPGEISRSGISQATGITRATISRLVDELINAGLVLELEPSIGGRGRPANRLTPAPGRAVALGLEVNISALDAVIIDLGGNEIARNRIEGDFANSDHVEVMTSLADMAHALVEEHLPDGAIFLGSGLALPGLVSPDRLALAPNLGWRDIPLEKLLAPLSDLYPAIVANEADLAAFAVAHPLPGVPSGPASFVYISGEVGIGAGIIVDHRPFSGAHGWSGEIGHICADPSGPLCSCGTTGCLEAYLGLRALAERSGLDRHATVEDIRKAAENGSKQAREALEEGGAALGRALSAVINSADIPLVLLGGIVAELSEWLVPAAEKEIETRVLQYAWSQPKLEVIRDSQGLDSRGAAYRILQRLVDDPMAWTA
ncbi:ROK family transcriptional regulator [Actinomycetaceae bacterium UMB8039B]|uniref:ROK family transcriptional regulator n=1 Tax=unclassified Pauljensenia TaxID=2908895 RepID=UPI0015C7AA2B|nr:MULTISPECIES: ROK family transcriptional regulator [unclassified Pauljensenia]MDK7780256.1 ROK family transcriptional regulator [Actinomycetaceae bacterium UMB8041B]MDK8293156.1 ROK family transcriptional regulator [Actinomycetaceae bacterium UMB8039B]MDK8299416.1 ROK family transcriptional regulator [Actinomycetaceae bacterium UMB1218B]MDK8608761.1 ROK family transcriptional regulator [Actinomycetaceae bacterium UMB8041A]MDK8752533.1 ROK family transcriptional regulator [Actinomycetaceae b